MANTAAELDIAIEASLKFTGLGSAECDESINGKNGGSSQHVPVIDLTKDDAREQLWNAAQDIGFFIIIRHGIDMQIVNDAFDVSKWYFEQSLETKQKQSPFDSSNNAGFEYYRQVRPSTGVADQKESLQVTARADCMNGRWPSIDFQEKAQALLTASHKLSQKLLDMLEPYAIPDEATTTTTTGGNCKNVMSQSHTLWADDGQCTLRFLHYPPTADYETTQKLLSEGYWRAGPHTDWSNLTLLFQRLGQNGLECCANPRRATEGTGTLQWIPVDPVEGGIAVNIGDMLARWSGGRLYSNLHRVRLPLLDAHLASRYSIAFFAQSDKKTIIGKNGTDPPLTAGEYILSRIKSNFQSTVVHPSD